MFTRLTVCPKFYNSWLAVIDVAVAAKSFRNINAEEILTSGDKPIIFDCEREGDLYSVPF